MKIALTIIATMIGVGGVFWSMDDRFASAADLKAVVDSVSKIGRSVEKMGIRLDQKINQDKADNWENQLWRLQRRHDGRTCSPDDRLTCRILTRQIRDARK